MLYYPPQYMNQIGFWDWMQLPRVFLNMTIKERAYKSEKVTMVLEFEILNWNKVTL